MNKKENSEESLIALITEKFSEVIQSQHQAGKLTQAQIDQLAGGYAAAFLEVASDERFKKDIEALALAHQ